MNTFEAFLRHFEIVNYGIFWTAYQHSYCPPEVLVALHHLRATLDG